MSKNIFMNYNYSPKIAEGIYSLLEPYLCRTPLHFNVMLHTMGRKYYDKRFCYMQPKTQVFLPEQKLARTLWGIKFRLPIANAAGTFKNGDGYDLVAKLGAGAFIGGTSTSNPRGGNKRDGLHLPFIKLPQSKTSINFLGLPNLGDEILSKRVFTAKKQEGCPIGWSLMRSPDYSVEEAQKLLINSLFLYESNSQVDFLEINESCPNVKRSNNSQILHRLRNISEEFLFKRKRHLPVVVKLSSDFSETALIEVIREMANLGFDGVNLGNTSTDYDKISDTLDEKDKELFNYFTTKYGGGVGGRVLKNKSLSLCKVAINELKKLNLQREFHVIRTGGIETIEDVKESEAIGVSLNHWHTGFFYKYLNEGNKVYKKMFEELE